MRADRRPLAGIFSDDPPRGSCWTLSLMYHWGLGKVDGNSIQLEGPNMRPDQYVDLRASPFATLQWGDDVMGARLDSGALALRFFALATMLSVSSVSIRAANQSLSIAMSDVTSQCYGYKSVCFLRVPTMALQLIPWSWTPIYYSALLFAGVRTGRPTVEQWPTTESGQVAWHVHDRYPAIRTRLESEWRGIRLDFLQLHSQRGV